MSQGEVPALPWLKRGPEDVDKSTVKVLEKLTAIRLAEVLSQKSVVPTDSITDALYIQDQHKEPFVDVLISSGHITEWDLAKVVVEHFQLPFIMADSYEISVETKDFLPEDVLFRHQIVPLDRFGEGLTLAMPIMTPFEVLSRIKQDHGCQVFAYVGLVSENKKVLQDLYPGFREWSAKDEKRRQERRATPKEKKTDDWMNIFDSGDQAVHGSETK